MNLPVPPLLSREMRRLLAVIVAVVPLLLPSGCRPAATVGAPGPAAVARSSASAPLRPLSEPARQQVERFCGDCHRLPAAESFPKANWPHEVRQGYDFYLTSLRSDLPRPAEGDAIRYFQDQAPESLTIPRAADRSEGPATVAFVRAELGSGVELARPALAQVLLVPPVGGGDRLSRGGVSLSGAALSGVELLTTDMRGGEIRRWRLGAGEAISEVIGRGTNPCRLSAYDVAADGGSRWLVGDLGSFLPEDHSRGAAFVLDETSGSVAPLLEGVSRVIEARPFDFDGDGHRDCLVAEFGWRATGALSVVIEEASGQRRREILDPRHGVLGVQVADLDGDGSAEIIAAFAQEHETVDAWFRRRPVEGGAAVGATGELDGRATDAWEHRELLRLPDPSWGSSGLEIVDLDGDGDLDILHCNGDTMDTGLARPEHGIRALLNDGKGGFSVVEIAAMPGVSQASAADLDGDGDQDIVAVALHPAAGNHPPGTFDSVFWLEQRPGGNWAPHAIEFDRCQHAALAIGDVDSDGRLDVIVGNWLASGGDLAVPGLDVWLNRPATAALPGQPATASGR